MTLRERYVDSLRFAKKSELTIRQYTIKLDKFNDFLKNRHNITLDTREEVVQIDGLMCEDYQKSLRELNMSSSNEMAHVIAVRAYFAWLEKMLIIDAGKNPAGAFASVKIQHKEQPHFDWSEAEQMFKLFTSRNKARDVAILSIALILGLRVSGIIGLKMSDVDFEKKTITFVNKGGAVKTVYAPDTVLTNIKSYIDQSRADALEEDPLFVSERGNQISADAVRNICKNAGNIVGKKGTPHAMRRTCLSRIDELQGREMAQIAGGHASAQTTSVYIYPSNERMDKVYADMDLSQ